MGRSMRSWLARWQPWMRPWPAWGGIRSMRPSRPSKVNTTETRLLPHHAQPPSQRTATAAARRPPPPDGPWRGWPLPGRPPCRAPCHLPRRRAPRAPSSRPERVAPVLAAWTLAPSSGPLPWRPLPSKWRPWMSCRAWCAVRRGARTREAVPPPSSPSARQGRWRAQGTWTAMSGCCGGPVSRKPLRQVRAPSPASTAPWQSAPAWLAWLAPALCPAPRAAALLRRGPIQMPVFLEQPCRVWRPDPVQTSLCHTRPRAPPGTRACLWLP